MLNRKEGEVMNAVYTLCHDKGLCLVSPSELLQMLPPKNKLTEDELEKILSALALDDYFELMSSERKGEKTYVISMHANGYAYKRCNQQRKRELTLRFCWAIASAVIAFLVGWLLKLIF
jgi:hypothetical protein